MNPKEMEPLPTSATTAATPATALPASVAPAPRRADSGVSLGLFSKIAAARKEKLVPVKDDGHSRGSMRALLDSSANSGVSSSNAPAFEKRAPHLPAASAAPSASGLPSHFPEIHDASLSRTAVSRAPPNPRKVTARTFAQNLRWTKHGFAADESAKPATASGSYISNSSNGTPQRRSTTISPAVRTMQPERLQPPQQQRRSVLELVRRCASHDEEHSIELLIIQV